MNPRETAARFCSPGQAHEWTYGGPSVGTYTCQRCGYTISKESLKLLTDPVPREVLRATEMLKAREEVPSA